jgi:hypothetical protein
MTLKRLRKNSNALQVDHVYSVPAVDRFFRQIIVNLLGMRSSYEEERFCFNQGRRLLFHDDKKYLNFIIEVKDTGIGIERISCKNI